MRILKNHFAELKNSGEIAFHLFFEFLDLQMSELVFGVVEDFLRQHFEDVEIILADIHVGFGGGADLVDEVGPGGVPLVLDYLDEDAVALREDVVQGPREILLGRVF